MIYTDSHEWIKTEGQIATVGITEKAREEIGEVVYLQLPKVGDNVRKGDEIIVLESTKAAVDICTPVSGKITEVNSNALEHINTSPEAEGWLFKLSQHELQEKSQ